VQAVRPAPLDTSLVTPVGTWAVTVMGGSAAQHNDFWQMFIRPAGSSRWQLVTPPGAADNGGLVLTASDGPSLVTGFRPSQNLTFTPLIETSDGGQRWSSLSPLDAALAGIPDALAIKPGSGSLLAVLADDTAEQAIPGYTTLTTLVSQRTLATTPPGRRCGLQDLTAATFTHLGSVLAGSCARPRNRRHLHPLGRPLAGNGTRCCRRSGPPGRHRPPADPHRPRPRGAACGRHRTHGQPSRHLVRRRQALDTVTAAQAQRRDIGHRAGSGRLPGW
jgi:hypothetical protein